MVVLGFGANVNTMMLWIASPELKSRIFLKLQAVTGN